jgi:hypothetical protein
VALRDHGSKRTAHAAAQLLGYAQATYAKREETIEANEAAAFARAQSLAATALGDAAFKRAHADGATLHDMHIAELAFGRDDG